MRTVLPFISTRPDWDVRWAFLLLPLWWVLGIEQFIPVALVGLAALKLATFRRRVARHPVLGWMALFLAIQIVSAVFIVEPFRFVSFARTFGLYAMAFGVVVTLVPSVRCLAGARTMLSGLVVGMTVTAVVGSLASIGWWRPEFDSLAARFLPGPLRETGYGQLLAHRQVGDVSWFAGLGDYFRLDGFFLFSTTYAAALAITLPIALYFVNHATPRHRWVYSIAVFLISYNLLFTTGRMAILAFFVAGGYWFLGRLRMRGRLAAGAVLLTVGMVLVLGTTVGLLSNVAEAGAEPVLLGRGGGSLVSRTQIYSYSLQGVADRPVFGWGTERDVEGLTAYPAGSHSDVLGTLYRHGFAGLFVYGALWWSIWASTSLPTADRETRTLLRYIRWSILVAAIVSITTVMSLDTSLMLVFWTVVGTGCSIVWWERKRRRYIRE